MNCIEINKYPPSVQRKSLVGDWTSCSQIAVGALTLEDYLAVEDRYVSAVNRIVGGRALQIKHVEMWNEGAEDLRRIGLGDVLADGLQPSENESVDRSRLENIVRRCLRESAWLELGILSELVIHFGYDLRVFVVAVDDLSPFADEIRRNDGLFVYKANPDFDTLQSWGL